MNKITYINPEKPMSYVEDNTDYNTMIVFISDVSEYYLEDCVKTIIESNPTVTFKSIQYAKEWKEVYFLVDKDSIVCTQPWYDKEKSKFKPLTSYKEMLGEMKRVLQQEDCRDNRCISLHTVLTTISDIYHKHTSFENSLERYLNSKISCDDNIYVLGFNYTKMQLKISFGLKENKYINFTKKDGDLQINNYFDLGYSIKAYARDILNKCGDVISECFDEYVKNEDFFCNYEDVDTIESINSRFLVYISRDKVTLRGNYFGPMDFTLDYFASGMCKCDCTSNDVMQLFKNRENEILKKIFIEIHRCPKWLQPILYKKREKQLKIYPLTQLIDKIRKL